MPSFSITRETEIRADPTTIHHLLNDFRGWRDWSPWERLDPRLERTYSGPETGVGSSYAWKGNEKAGEGRMEIVASTNRRIDVDIDFIAPFKASNRAVFTLAPHGEVTRLSWTMTGERNRLFAIAGKLFFDRALGKDFDKGLNSLKSLAEQRRQQTKTNQEVLK